jgi:hypothetical protein
LASKWEMQVISGYGSKKLNLCGGNFLYRYSLVILTLKSVSLYLLFYRVELGLLTLECRSFVLWYFDSVMWTMRLDGCTTVMPKMASCNLLYLLFLAFRHLHSHLQTAHFLLAMNLHSKHILKIVNQ